MEHRRTNIFASVVVRRGRHVVGAGLVILAAASRALAHHDGVGGGSEMGGGNSIGGVLPLVIGVVLLMVGVGVWDRKKRKAKPRRGRRRK